MKRKGFKSFVLKVCETKGVADAFLRKCVNLRDLTRESKTRGKLLLSCRGSDLRLSDTGVGIIRTPSREAGLNYEVPGKPLVPCGTAEGESRGPEAIEQLNWAHYISESNLSQE